MTDILRNDHAIQRALPNQYSELLQPACNGHALWAPRRTAEGGGALGDIGYIRDGSFWKEGNVYVDPPVSIQPLVVPTSGIYRGEHFHMPIMQSSSSSTVSFQVTGSATPATLPLTSVSVEPRFILKRKRLAFLAPPIPTVRDTVSVANETAFCDWLTDNRHRLDPSLVVLTHVVRSSGWIGGVVTGRNSNASVSVSGPASALATVGMDASVEYEVARLALTQGPRPTEWSENDAEYTLIVRFTRMRTRLQRQLHKFKLALSAGNAQQSSDTLTPSAGTALMPRQLSISDWGQGSAESPGMSAAEDQAGQTSEQNEDDIDSVDDASYDAEGDEGDRTCLDGILDMILDDNQDVDFVVADSRIIAAFIQTYPHLSYPELAVFDQESKPTRIRPSFTTRSIPSPDGNTTEIVACVTRLSLVEDDFVLPSNVDSYECIVEGGKSLFQPPPTQHQQRQLPAHYATETPGPVPSVPSSPSVGSDMSDKLEPVATRAESLHEVLTHDGINEDDEDTNIDEQHAPSQAGATEDVSDRGAPSEAADVSAEENGLLTPSSSSDGAHQTSRMSRSASADPYQVSWLSHEWNTVSSTLKQTAGDETETDETETDDHAGFHTGRASGEENKPRKHHLPHERKSKKVGIDDFEMVRELDIGCAGGVLLVRHKAENKVYALKVITKRHVLAQQELQHTLTEQAVLKRMAREAKDPFVVRLWWSFHDNENLFFVMDFHPGGNLRQLARWGRLERDRARFYAAEIVEGVEGLHNSGIIYRDLKPENILIGRDGHIVLTDFGLSKESPRRPSTIDVGALLATPSTPSASARASISDYDSSGSNPSLSNSVLRTWMNCRSPRLPNDQTNTFCGTAEYLAPEVIQGLPYSYEVDWWSFGTMLYEMLTGITPFWANNHSDMYVRVLQDELTFPDDRTMDKDTKSLLRELLQRDPSLRMSEPRIKRHPYFSLIDWSHVYFKRYIPPYIPPTDPANITITQNFGDTFLDMEPTVENDPDEDMLTDEDKDRSADDGHTDGEESVKPLPAAKSPLLAVEEDDPDVFDGYSYKARNSVIMEDDDEDIHEESTSLSQGDQELRDLVNDTVHLDTYLAEGESTMKAKIVPKPPTAAPPSPPRPEKSLSMETTRVVLKGHRKVRRERSGVAALDRELDEDESATEREDDDWDFTDMSSGENHNNHRGTSLFARSVVDRYRLSVFSRKGSPLTSRTVPQSVPGISSANSDVAASDSPTRRDRGRSTGLGLKTKTFLRAKSPPSTFSSSTSRSFYNTGTSTSASSSGILTPSPSVPLGQSLRTRPSLTSVAPSFSSDQSLNSDSTSVIAMSSVNGSGSDRDSMDSSWEMAEKPRAKKLKKKGAEKMFALFASPR